MNNRVIHFEIQADDAARAQAFYEKALGWKIKKVEMEDMTMEYWMIDTGTGPGIGGGIYKRPEKDAEKFFTYDCTVSVEDIDKSIADVKTAGGEIIREKTEMKGVGWFASCRDTEGNRFSLMQPTDWKPME